MKAFSFTALSLALGLSCAAHADNLRIAISSEPTAIDPHYHQATPNDSLAKHIFDTLADHDIEQKLRPSLAESWEIIDDNTWKFHLRSDVKFSNGEPFTSKDVVYTMCRILNNDQAVAGSFSNVSQQLSQIETPDDHTLIFKTTRPYPILINELSRLPILWHGISPNTDSIEFDNESKCGVQTGWPQIHDFNTGKAAIGTGPFTLTSYVKGAGIKLAQNPHYWGPKPDWTSVELVSSPSSGPRLAGLLAGDFDLIEGLSARDLPRVEKNDNLQAAIAPSTRVIYLQLDIGRDQSPQIKTADGSNPLQKLEVRQALSLAINRQAIIERIMGGVAMQANQFLPDGMFGALKTPAPLEYNPQKAKELLAKAGYPDGFEITLSAPNDRYINDAQIAQTVAQYLAQVGIKVNVDVMTRSVYFPKRAKQEFSMALGGWSSETNEASSFLQFWVHSYAPELSFGTSNYGRYSNPAIDSAFEAAYTTMDPTNRDLALQKVVTMTLDELPSIPLHFESSAWAFKKGIHYAGRMNQYTLAHEVKKQ